MFELLLISKLIVSIAAVIGLSLIAEHLSPRIAGIMAGYPLGTAIALFFIGIEQGKGFAAQGAVYTLAGFSLAIVLFYVYHWVCLRVKTHTVLIASLISVCAFLILSALLRQLPLNLPIALAITVFCIFFFGRQFRHYVNTQVGKRVQLTRWVLLIRALAAAAIVILVTGLAAIIGAEGSGLLSAFPITAFPFVIIIHLTYGVDHVNTIIKNYPYGLGSLVVYVITVMFTYPQFGVGWGTLMAFGTATVYLLFFIWLTRDKKAMERTA